MPSALVNSGSRRAGVLAAVAAVLASGGNGSSE
jgi:hypothetical protein